LAKVIEPRGYGGAELDNEARLRPGRFGSEGVAELAKLRHRPQVGYLAGIERLAPAGRGGRIGVRLDAEQFAPNRETAGLGFRRQKTQLPLQDREVLVQPGERVGQADRTGHGHAANNLAEAALANDVGEEALAAAGVGAE